MKPMQTTIICPRCKNAFQIEEALKHQVEEELEKKFEEKHAQDLTEATKRAEEKTMGKLAKDFELRLENAAKEAQEERERNKGLLEQLKGLTEEVRALRRKDEERELEMKRKLAEGEKEIFTEARAKSDEENKSQIERLTKQLADVAKMNEDLKRKVEQGSQQLQGEVPELRLETDLKRAFMYDLIEPVGKGVKGADVRQIVKTKIGNTCGVILWESKEQKAWSNEWITKLKNDLRAENANIPIIVSTQLPEEARSGFGIKEDVYIVSPALVLPIAEALRQRLIGIAREKFLQNKGDKADKLYTYVTSHEFTQKLEAIAETYLAMKNQITRERMAFEKSWKLREAQIDTILRSAGGIVGKMQEAIGSALPPIKTLELSSGDDQASD